MLLMVMAHLALLAMDTDGYGTWLINGSNPAYSVDDAMNVTGTTSYTIDAYTAE